MTGDTHGRIEGIRKALVKYKTDYLIHTGDFFADARRLAHYLKVPYYAVAGNCDSREAGPDEALVEIQQHRIYISHGHQYGVKSALQNLVYRGLELEAGAVIFGHTHVPHCEKVGNIWLLNPGSPSRPRLGADKSFLVIDILPEGLYPALHSLQ